MSEPALDVEDVCFRYDHADVLEGVSLRLEAGQRVGLLGRNGSGKTTLLRLVSTQLPVQRGRIEVGGTNVARAPSQARSHLGVVFQRPALDGNLTVQESLRLQAALVGIETPRRDGVIRGALEDAGLEERADQRVSKLSGGLARRLDLARALLHRPALALLDEPTTGLDPIARAAFADVLERHRETAQLIATHDMDEAERCDHVVILDAGRVVEAGSPRALTERLGRHAVWLETTEPRALADALGPGARVVGEQVMVDARPSDLEALYARPDVLSASLRPPDLEDVFTAAVGTRPEAR